MKAAIMRMKPVKIEIAIDVDCAVDAVWKKFDIT